MTASQTANSARFSRIRPPMTDSRVETDEGAPAEPPSSLGSSLLELLRANSPEAWRRLIHLFGPLVYRWCRGRGLQAADAADVGQDVFRAVAANIGQFRRDRPNDSFRGWLWTVTRNKIADHWRRRQKHPEASGGTDAQMRFANIAAEEPTGSDEPADPETPGSLYQRALELIQGEFQERTWQAFWHVTVDGRTPADAAAELGMTVNSVYLAKSRVLRRLREELGDLFD